MGVKMNSYLLLKPASQAKYMRSGGRRNAGVGGYPKHVRPATWFWLYIKCSLDFQDYL